MTDDCHHHAQTIAEPRRAHRLWHVTADLRFPGPKVSNYPTLTKARRTGDGGCSFVRIPDANADGVSPSDCVHDDPRRPVPQARSDEDTVA